ncbi:MAG: hypothetical protein AOA66_0083 [Candidatus Bathyarchaeota archaeon BA2]|nr:MAG: hypothetical protein AOA66_0083 [Candidatus Bathyarchaeota archaeon BA2]
MERLRAEKILVIPLASILENVYPVYRMFSREYVAPEKGLEKLQSLAHFYLAILFEERIGIYNLTLGDTILALRIANEDKNLFIDEKGSLKLFDALIAAAWTRTRFPLYTVDEGLRKFGERHGLECREIEKEVSAHFS